MTTVFIGGDGGTSGNKMVAVDEEGKVVAEFGPCGDYPIISDHAGWSEQSLDRIHDAENAGLAGIVMALNQKGIKPEQIGGICTTMQMHTDAYLDADFNPVRENAILWNDARSGAEVQAMIDHFGLPGVIQLVNNHPTPGYSLFHALWIKEHEPEAWEKTRHISLMNSSFGRLLTGKECINHNDAAGTCAYDVSNHRWSGEVAVWSGVPIEYWPKVVRPEYAIGQTDGIKRVTGIPDGIPVVAGLGDCAACALGGGVVLPGRLCSILGTAGIFVAPTTSLISDIFGGGRVQSYEYVMARGQQLYHTLTTNLSAGALLERLAKDYRLSLTELDGLTTLLPIETNRPLVDSRLCGERTGNPGWKPNAKGAILYLDLNCATPGHIWLAALKSIIFNQMIHLQIQLELGVQADEAILLGGGTKSSLYTRILVAGLNAIKPGLLCRLLPGGQGGGARGMAILAGHGVGDIKDLAAVAANLDYGEPIEPDEQMVAIIREQFDEWLELCYSLQ